MFARMRKKAVGVISIAILLTALAGCAEKEEKQEPHFSYRYASQEEGIELLSGNEEYYNGFSQNDLDYKMQKAGATMEEYQAFAEKQVREFSEEEKQLIDDAMAEVEQIIEDNDYVLPDIEEIVFIKTTQEEEAGSTAYTHGTQIYFGDRMLEHLASEDEEEATLGVTILWHEIFHCLTRCTPEFRTQMYDIIHFTVQEEDFEIPPSVFEYSINNPDVEHHNSYATFIINGEPVDCFTVWMTTKNFEKEGDSFFDYMVTALVPIDGSDLYYTSDEAENFYDVFGKNTDYVIDPEECMADNFSFAMMYGTDGMDYASPDIIDQIIEAVSPQK